MLLLIRHGESELNAGLTEAEKRPVVEKDIALTPRGIEQAKALGKQLWDGGVLRAGAQYIQSPYRRARETMAHFLEGVPGGAFHANLEEDPRWKELDHGYGTVEQIESQMIRRDEHGRFFYRFAGGQAPADIYPTLRVMADDLFAQHFRVVKPPDTYVVSHSITIRVFVMAFFGLTYEAFDLMKSPANCKPVIIDWLITGGQKGLGPPVYQKGPAGCWGIELRETRVSPDPEYNFGKAHLTGA